MKLFLASEGHEQKTIEKLKSYIPDLQNKKVAYIPTAANGHEWGCWKNWGSIEIIQNHVGLISTIILEEINETNLLENLESNDIIWIGGGMPGYLMYWIRRTKLNVFLQSLLENKIFVGSSAGSMIVSKSLDVSEWYIGEEEPGASLIPGLGLVDFDIYPHYENNLFEKIKENYKGKKLYLLKNGEAITVEDNKVTVLGEERIITNN